MSERSAARQPHQSASPAPRAGYYKAGVYERLLECETLPDGRALHAISKAIAALLIGRAMASRHYTCSVTDDEIARKLGGLTRVTVRKYLAPLVELQLVSYELGAGCRRYYNCLPLFQRFGEERPTATRQKVSSIVPPQVDKECPPEQLDKIYPPRAQTTQPVDKEGAAGGQSLSTSITSTSFASSLIDARALREQLGVKDCPGMDDEIFAIDDYCTRWKLTLRARRRIVKRYGIAGVHGAVGYVVQEQRLARYGTIQNPAGLLYYALRNRLIGPLAKARAAEEEEQVVKVYPPPSAGGRGLGEAIWDWVDARVGGAFAKMFRSRATLEIEHGALRIRCGSRFDASNIADRKALFKEAVHSLYGINLDIEIVQDTP